MNMLAVIIIDYLFHVIPNAYYHLTGQQTFHALLSHSRSLYHIMVIFYLLSYKKIALMKSNKYLFFVKLGFLTVIVSIFLSTIFNNIPIEYSFQQIFNGLPFYYFYSYFLIAFTIYNNADISEQIKKIIIGFFFFNLSGIVIGFFLNFDRISIFSYFNSVFVQFTKVKLGFFLGAGNDDSNFILAIFPFVVLTRKSKSQKFITIFVVLLFLFFMGTRTALISSIILSLILINYISYSKFKKILLVGSIALFVIYFAEDFYLIFRLVFKQVDLKNISGTITKEGTLYFRIYYLWLPIVNYVTETSNWIWGMTPYLVAQIQTKFTGIKWVGASTANGFVFVFSNFGIFSLIFYILTIGFVIFEPLIKSEYFDENIKLGLTLSGIGYLMWAMMSNGASSPGIILLILFSAFIISKIKSINNYNKIGL